MLLVPTITIQAGHLSHKIHHDLKYDCPSDSRNMLLLDVGAHCSLLLGLFWFMGPFFPFGENFRDENSEMRNVNSADMAL